MTHPTSYPFSNTPELAYIAFGSNLGDRKAYIDAAIKKIDDLPRTTPLAISKIYNTAPQFYEDQPDFLNGVIVVETEFKPQYLLLELLRIEHHLGRRRQFRNAPRQIDLDLLMLGDLCLEIPAGEVDGCSLPALKLPHPGIQDRLFVLEPLVDVAKDLQHPVLKLTMQQLLDRLKGKES